MRRGVYCDAWSVFFKLAPDRQSGRSVARQRTARVPKMF